MPVVAVGELCLDVLVFFGAGDVDNLVGHHTAYEKHGQRSFGKYRTTYMLFTSTMGSSRFSLLSMSVLPFTSPTTQIRLAATTFDLSRTWVFDGSPCHSV